MGWALVLGLGLVLHTIVNELLNSASRCIASFKTTPEQPETGLGMGQGKAILCRNRYGFLYFRRSKGQGHGVLASHYYVF